MEYVKLTLIPRRQPTPRLENGKVSLINTDSRNMWSAIKSSLILPPPPLFFHSIFWPRCLQHGVSRSRARLERPSNTQAGLLFLLGETLWVITKKELVPWPGIKPMPLQWKCSILNTRTAREVPPPLIFEDEIPGGKVNFVEKKKSAYNFQG